MERGSDTGATARFFIRAARELAGVDRTDGLAVLDFGCGGGDLVRALRDLGLDARGCDFSANLDADEHLSPIPADPYRLPYPDDSFDLVISTSVFEHAQQTEECMAEIHRVLRPGGMHARITARTRNGGTPVPPESNVAPTDAHHDGPHHIRARARPRTLPPRR